MSRRYNRQPVFGQLVPSLPNSYTERTSRPIYALIYLLVFLVLYEIGIFFIQPEVLTQSLVQPEGQVVAFYWVRMALRFLGFSTRMTWIAAPLLVIVILLALQFTSKSSWRVKWGDFVLMTAECVLLAIPLIVLSLLLNRAVSESNAALPAGSTTSNNYLLVDIVTGIGAGIYEELVFRLVLICFLMLLFQDVFRLRKTTAVFWSVMISAVTFSIHHHFFYANGQFYRGDSFTVSKFLFRALAGIYFAVLYAVRGFGVTAGTHAFYNILAAILRMMVFVIQSE
ncbi:MAG: CPBP family intramembrane metalloprotease [Phycisphaerae bacterium]|nr:CPBP family intramembrane metalloprotease [Phycisphaerae bacterium]